MAANGLDFHPISSETEHHGSYRKRGSSTNELGVGLKERKVCGGGEQAH
jgi:hypothetical protein